MLHKLMRASKGRNFLIKLVTHTLLVSVVPLLLLSLLFYQNTRSTMKAELQAANLASLHKSVHAMELVIDQIGNSFMQFITDSTYRDYAQFPRGEYYEQLTGAFNAEDMPGLQKYLSSKAKLSFNIDNLRMSSSFIDSVYMFDRSKNMMLTQNDLQFPADRFYDKDWNVGLTNQNYAYPIIMDVRNAEKLNGTRKLVIPIVFKSSNEDNLVVFNLDAQLVYDNIVKKLDGKTSGSFSVYSKGRKMMLYDRDDKLAVSADRELRESALLEGTGQETEIRLDNYRLMATSATSARLGWTFVSLTDLDVLYTSINNLRGIMMTVGLLLFVATALLAFLTSRHIYNPIRHLLHFVASNRGASSASAGKSQVGELKTIRNGLMEAYEDRKSLQVRLKESLPAYREKFLHTLIKAGTYSKEEISERMRFLEIDFGLQGIALLMIMAEEPQGRRTDVEWRNMIKLRAIETIERIVAIPGQPGALLVELGEETVALLVNCREERFKESFALAERIRSGIREEIGLNCSVGIGTYCREITEVPRAYEEAAEALGYRDMTGQGDVIYIEDVRPENGHGFYYPKDKEEALQHYIKTGDKSEARRVLNEMLGGAAQGQGGKAQFRQAQQLWMRLLVGLMDTAAHYKLDLQKTMQAKHNLYAELQQKSDFDDICAWFSAIVDTMTDSIGEAQEERSSRHVQEVLAIIERDCGDNVSLSQIAERLGLSPSYLSRSFKEKTGQTFMAYLTAVRIEKSKSLLLGSDLMVKDICERLGYVKVNYFIKLFKECTGTTPGEFRKMHGHTADAES
ncbi:MAG: helix-turn-helix domain-containing protein [Paenibacillaceae bacterium]|nr:helix-turn-helix domain-containing protein [Paenibacillaceae bacterium]